MLWYPLYLPVIYPGRCLVFHLTSLYPPTFRIFFSWWLLQFLEIESADNDNLFQTLPVLIKSGNLLKGIDCCFVTVFVFAVYKIRTKVKNILFMSRMVTFFSSYGKVWEPVTFTVLLQLLFLWYCSLILLVWPQRV